MIFSAALFVLAVLLIGGLILFQAQRAALPVMSDVDVYAEQLRGLERDLAKGVLQDEEFTAMRANLAIKARTQQTGQYTTAPKSP